MIESTMMEEWKQKEIKKMREQFRKYIEFRYFDLLLKKKNNIVVKRYD